MINTAKMTVSPVSIRTLGNSSGIPNVDSLVLLSSSPLLTCFRKQLEFLHKHEHLQVQKCVQLLSYMKNFENHCLNRI